MDSAEEAAPAAPAAAPMPEQIMELYNELGRPSASKFATELRATFGMTVTPAEVQKSVVGLQSERQVVAPLSLGLDEKWVADIMTLPAAPSGTC